MSFLSLLLQRFRATRHSEQVHSEISDELRFHMDMKADELIRRGMAPDKARIEAARSFGSVDRTQERGYDVRGGGLLEQLWGDARFAVRFLRKQWMKTAILVSTLAIGVGVNTAVFGVISAVLLRPLPFPEANKLVVLHQANHGQTGGVSYPHFLDWRASSRSFQDLAVYSGTSAILTGQGDATVVSGAIASASLFRVLRVQPLRGRLFQDQEDRLMSNASSVSSILISDRLWQSRFGRREDIIGLVTHLDARTCQIIGIIPSQLAFPLQKDPIDFWATVAVDSDPSLYGGSIPVSRGYPRYDGVIARLKQGATLAQSRQEMALIAKNIAREHPHATSSNDIAIDSVLDDVVGASSKTMILLLYAAAFCVFAIACINVANILLVDALARRREFAVRLALGAPLIKLVRQLLVENTIVALAGGFAGLCLAWAALRLFLTFAPRETPRLEDIHLDVTAFFYVVAISLFSGLLFSCLPAFAMRQKRLSTFFREGDRSVARRASLLQPRTLLICGQIVLGMILTCCAGVLVSSFKQILQANRGFDPHGVLTASVSLPIAKYGQGSAGVIAYFRSLLQDLRAVPGVQAVTLSEVLPLSGRSNSTTLNVVGQPESSLRSTGLRFVEPSYFAALHIPLMRGRFFNEFDTSARPGCAIVNRAFVRQYLQGSDPFQRKLKLGWGGGDAKQIVGVVEDIRHTATSPSAVPEVYIPFAQFPLNDMSVLIRTTGDPYVLTSSLRKVGLRLDPSVPLDPVRTLDDYLLLSSMQQQFLMWLLVVFSSTAIVLSAIGLYGALSDAVLSRSREFGIRLALGSSTSGVFSLVLGQGLGMIVTGLVVGAIGAVLASRLMLRWLYDPNQTNFGVFVLSGCVLLIAALAACWLPSRRASNLDPASLLRSE